MVMQITDGLPTWETDDKMGDEEYSTYMLLSERGLLQISLACCVGSWRDVYNQ